MPKTVFAAHIILDYFFKKNVYFRLRLLQFSINSNLFFKIELLTITGSWY